MLMTWLDPRPLVLPKKFPSPAYSALMVWTPCANEEIVKLAVPRLNPTGEPSGDPSAVNCTVPDGFPLPGAIEETAAVNVTFDPVGDGLAEEETAVDEDAGVMLNVPLTKLNE